MEPIAVNIVDETAYPVKLPQFPGSPHLPCPLPAGFSSIPTFLLLVLKSSMNLTMLILSDANST